MANTDSTSSTGTRAGAIRSATPYSLSRILSSYETVLKSKESITIADLLEVSPEAVGKKAVFRFDVERRPKHALMIAQHLSNIGAVSTMYFHTRKGCYDVPVMREIQRLGHEVGFHHECLDRCQGNFAAARESFLRDVEKIRGDSINLRTVCAHGELGIVKKDYRCNSELFDRYPSLLSEAGISGEVYIQVKRNYDFTYATDTFTGYSSFWNRIESGRKSDRLLQILVHPHRWHTVTSQTLIECGTDIVRKYRNKITKVRQYESPWPV